ncbi:uncharacterized protein LOC108732676 isoform X2 [Agrilus planipennis]|uniref:Uncharacterized protein LOC108732676 isoform X2 n=1 Tax=Agrilus planipennis TaxID=224129 RepID=A0A1W4WGH7_AGRPL|nr:uncharacterized protein LOC108732676 isoform X2 [Agrilus planipennis]
MDGSFKRSEVTNESSLDIDQQEHLQAEFPFSVLTVPSVSPSKSRYGRTCKPKISTDYYNIDDIFETTKTKKQAVSKNLKKISKSDSEVTPKKLISKYKANHNTNLSFVHVTGETNFANLDSKNNISCSGKRKFKLNKNNSHSVKTKQDRLSTEGFLQNGNSKLKENGIDNVHQSEEKQFDEDLTTNLTKVFKIISDKSALLNEKPDINLRKHPVKTYGNRKKFMPRRRVVESFGLPDLPIFPVENEPPLNKSNQGKDIYFKGAVCDEDANTVNKNVSWDFNLNKDEFEKCSANKSAFNKTNPAGVCKKNSYVPKKELLLKDEFEKIKLEKQIRNRLSSKPQENNVIENMENNVSTSECLTVETLSTRNDESKSTRENENEVVPQTNKEKVSNIAIHDLQFGVNSDSCTKSNIVSSSIKTQALFISDLSNKTDLCKIESCEAEVNIDGLNSRDTPQRMLRSPLKKLKLERGQMSKTLRKSPRINSLITSNIKRQNLGSQSVLKLTKNVTLDKPAQEPEQITEGLKMVTINEQLQITESNPEELNSHITINKKKTSEVIVNDGFVKKEKRNAKEGKQFKIDEKIEVSNETPNDVTINSDQQRLKMSKLIEVSAIEENKKKGFKNNLPLRRSPIKRSSTLSNNSQSTSPKQSPSEKPVIMEDDLLKEIEQITHTYSPPKEQKARRKNSVNKFRIGELSAPKNIKVPKISKPKKASLKTKEDKKYNFNSSSTYEQPIKTEDSVNKPVVDKKISNLINEKREIFKAEFSKRTLRSSTSFISTIDETITPYLGKKKKSKNGTQSHTSLETSSLHETTEVLPKHNADKTFPNMNETLHIKEEVDDMQPAEKAVYEVGDLVWARVGTCPFWPSMVCVEPGTEVLSRTLIRKGPQQFYHVKFFGDRGKRSWINFRNMFPYQTKNDLEVLFNKNKSKPVFKKSSGRAKLYQFYKVSKHFIPKWKKAVEEIDSLKFKTVSQRLDFFETVALAVSNIVKIKKEKKAKSPKNKTDLSPPRLLRSHVTGEDSLKKMESPKPHKCKSNKSTSRELNFTERISFNNFVSKHIKGLKESKPELDEKSMEKHLQDLWNNLNPREKKIYGFSSDVTSEYSDSDTQSSSKGSTSSAIPHSMEEQVKLYKRNNLFKKVSRQRVCNYCEKPEGVLKCKGPCNGLYHPQCTRIINLDNNEGIKIKIEKEDEDCLEEKHAIKMEDDCSDKGETVSSTRVADVLNSVTKVMNPITKTMNSPVGNDVEEFDPNKEIKVEQIEEHFNSNNLLERLLVAENMNDDNRVEIISVYSDDSDDDIYELPPIEATSRRLSLFEQIDLKMKEVMGKVGDKTSYADSTTDLSSGDITESEETPKSDKTIISEEKHEQINDENVTNLKSSSQVSSSAIEKIEADDNFRCAFCLRDISAPCFVCGLEISTKGVSVRIKCSLYQCGKFYHLDCLKIWPQTQWSLINSSKSKKTDRQLESFVCPSHVCHTCVSDNPRAAISRCSSDKVVKCLRCPATYHTSNMCVPAGTIILSSSQILCPRHRKRIRNSGKLPNNVQTINTTWCFICSEGGNLICCETCPTSVHPDCLKVNLMDDDTFICEDCESGRFPLYDEIVWAKLGSFRWWPAIILFPNEVPDNVNNLPHREGEFVVRFFGSHDHYWVNRGRVFLFQEEDQGGRSHQKRKIDQLFNKAIDEAVAAYRLKKEFKSQKESEVKNGLKPPPYIKIKVNKPVGSVKQNDGNTSNTTACECDPKQPFPCGPDSDCINRLLLTECNPELCPAGDRCYNQRFEKRQYSPLEPYKTENRGWGLRSLAPIRKGDFVIEYVGELIDDTEYQRRIKRMHETKDENYYFLTVDKDRIIDAGPKGNLARFMNHSCQPNCETQKWTVNGDTKVGLFALEDIPANTELTFNYNLECVGKEKKVCKCGAQTCSGFIGLKFKPESTKKAKKKESLSKKKTISSPTTVTINDNVCFVCEKSGEVRGCCYKVCNKFYHLKCVSLQYWPEGNKWFCPSHNCNICGKRTIRCCYKCINSYCPSHAEGNVRYDRMLGFVCSDHDPARTLEEKPLQNNTPRRKSRVTTTKETDITSTTDDIVIEAEMPLKDIRNQNNSCEEHPSKEKIISTKVYLKPEDDFAEVHTMTSTPVKKSQNPQIVEETGTEEETELPHAETASSVSNKRKRRVKLKKNMRASKKIKLEDNVKQKRNVSVSNILSNISVQNEVKLSSTVPARHLRTTRNSLSNSTSDKFLKHQSELEKDLPIRKRTRLRYEVSAQQN